MCGIYGHVLFDGKADPERGLRRLNLLGHRGPDHTGHFIRNGLFLGHTRLGILDPEPGAHQPFSLGENRLIFNGEIYNFGELKAGFPETEWKTRSDTEVLIRVLAGEGAGGLEKLNGMFAFAYWDEAEQTLLLARDRTGIKPLYWRQDPTGLEFASELKAFEAKPISLGGLKEVLSRGYLGQGELPFPEIQELAPGHYVLFDLKRREWKMEGFVQLPHRVTREAMNRFREPSHWPSELKNRLEKSVELHLQSDAPLATLCSGGLDSSLLSALALRSRRDMRLYHCGVEGPGGEESHAVAVARHLKAELIVERIDAESFLDSLPRVTWHLDLPVYHPNDMALYRIAERARKDGIKVLLCGEGADELFGGYSWHSEFSDLIKARERLQRLGSVAGRVWNRLSKLGSFTFGRPNFTLRETSRFAAFGLAYPAPGIDRVYKGYSLFAENFAAWKRWDEALNAYRDLAPPAEAPVQALMLDNLRGHLRSILHRTDRILMAHSIEGRVPFLENGMIDFALNLPLAAKIRGRSGKALLKQFARRHLPASIVDRPKMGFPVPWEKYLPKRPRLLENGFLSQWTRLRPDQLAAFYADDSTLLFRLIALEVWGRIFAFGENPETIRVR